MSETIEGHSYETIPNEYWPKCDWCKQDLGEANHFNNSYGEMRICATCYSVLLDVLNIEIPSILENFFRSYENRNEHHERIPKPMCYEDHLKIAIKNMKAVSAQ